MLRRVATLASAVLRYVTAIRSRLEISLFSVSDSFNMQMIMEVVVGQDEGRCSVKYTHVT